jgi:hypothetical protein
LALATTFVALLAGTTTPAIAASATVVIDRGGYTCGVAAGDLPGLPGFSLANSTVVVLDDGSLNVTCTGSVPAGYSLDGTFAGDVVCDDGQRLFTGHIVGTTSGRVMVMCHVASGG